MLTPILIPTVVPKFLLIFSPSHSYQRKNGKYDKLKENLHLEFVKKEIESKELDESWNVAKSFPDIRMEHVHIIVQLPKPANTNASKIKRTSRLGGLGGTTFQGEEHGDDYEGIDLTRSIICNY
ncbi:hypothetical protein GLOIN_2v1791224 [Rhizophagus clarus]|uniref:Uncharacterized protein n=1 Tax=Rhizophagus clarus TaxID=94130 RepID=A0A8H3LR29_9GLOM|nr:hypothetical protein GLOIN_2v1791224 [Rhizophagus clarus]